MDDRSNNYSIYNLLEASLRSPEDKLTGLMKDEHSPAGRWLKECDVKHPQNKQERMLLNEKKKREKKNRKEADHAVEGNGNIEK